MPLEEDKYTRRTSDDVFESTEDRFENIFSDAEVNSGAIIEALLRANADTLSGQQEVALKRLYEASYLETATGVDLDRVVDVIGINRRKAVHATGVERWITASPVASDKLISKGTTVQTDSESPITFETSEAKTLKYLTGFESGSLGTEWNGDTGDFTVQSTTALDGNYSVEGTTSSSSLVYYSGLTYDWGSILHTQVELTTGGDIEYIFAYQDTSNYYGVRVDESGVFELNRVSGGTRTTLDSATPTVEAGTTYRLDIEWAVDGEITADLRDLSTDSVVSTVSETDKTFYEGNSGLRVTTSNPAYADQLTSSGVSTNIRAVEGGPDGNLGANALTVAPSPPSGIDSWTNTIPTGNDAFTDTDDVVLTIGQPRETDPELRERARETVTKGGSATVDALLSSLVNEFGDASDRGVENVESAKVFTNRTNSDNANGNGLPAKSFEVVVYGGDDTKVAKAIFDTVSVTGQPVGGNLGTEVTETVQASNGQSWTIAYSRPTPVNVDLTLDVVVTDTYDGDDPLRDRVVEYIGGTDSDGASVLGTDVDTDVVIDEIEQRIREDNGVRAVTSINTSPSTTTDSDGVEVVSIGNTEVARTDATDGSITVNVTEV